MTTLKEAREKGKLEELIKEHEADHDGNETAVEDTLEYMVDKSKSLPKTSSQDASSD